jgi:hypothetical protein
LRSGVAVADGVIHTGFIHDFSRLKAVCEIDEHAIEALGSALAGSDRPLIVTSGTGLISPGRFATEESRRAADSTFPRMSEEAADSLAARGVRIDDTSFTIGTRGRRSRIRSNSHQNRT